MQKILSAKSIDPRWIIVAICIAIAALVAGGLYSYVAARSAVLQSAQSAGISAVIKFSLSYERAATAAALNDVRGQRDAVAHLKALMAQYKTLPRSISGASEADAEEYRLSVASLGLLLEELFEDVKHVAGETQGTLALSYKLERYRGKVERVVALYEASSNSQLQQARETSLFGLGLLAVLGFLAVIGLGTLAVYARRIVHAQAKVIELQKAEVAEGKRSIEAATNAIMAKNQFFATISHELRTPLQQIYNAIDVIRLQAKTPREKTQVEVLITSVEQLEGQMRDLTDFQRLDAGKLELKLGTFNPAKTIQRVVQNFELAARAKNLRLSFHCPSPRVNIHSDSVRLQQIATNLVTNAIKYSEKGTIAVQLIFIENEGSGTVMRLLVQDSGLGIRKEHQDLIFQTFTQIDQTTTRRQEGAGLGLAIVKGLVNLFGGSINILSEIGKGSTFDVRLPVQVVDDAIGVADGPAPENGKPSGQRILVVDDHREIGQSTQQILVAKGYECDWAANGQDALQRVSETRYDAVLMDIQMPGMDGFTVAEKIRAGASLNREVPIIAVTGHDKYLIDAKTRSLFNNYVMKPVPPVRLEELLREALSAN